MDEQSRKTPGYWTVRSAYPIPLEEEAEEALKGQDVTSPDPSDVSNSTKSSMEANSPQKKKQRATRSTPAYLPNFVKLDEFYKERLLNTLNDTYFLPSDENEYDKLELSEMAFKTGFGGLYPCPDLVRAVLAPPPESSSDHQEQAVKEPDTGDATSDGAPVKSEKRGAQKSILDLEYTLFLFSEQLLNLKADNGSRFVAADLFGDAIRMDLPLFPSSNAGARSSMTAIGPPFDRMRDRILIKNYRRFMEEVTRCLKPGGLAIFIEGDYEMLAEDRMTVLPMAMSEDEIREMIEQDMSREDGDIPSETDATRATYWQQQSWAQPSGSEDGTGYTTPDFDTDDDKFISSSSLWTRGSWLQRYFYEVRYASQILGSDMSTAGATVDEGLWRMDLVDPETCGAASCFTPVGPWARCRGDYALTNDLQFAGSVMRSILLNGVRAYLPFFLRVGVSQSTLDHWTGAIDHELQSQKFHSWLRLRIAWGQRKADTAPTPPSSTPTQDMLTPPVTEPSLSAEQEAPLTPDQLRLLSQIQRVTQQSKCQMVVYESREECLMAKEARQLTRPRAPKPHVQRIQELKHRE